MINFFKTFGSEFYVFIPEYSVIFLIFFVLLLDLFFNKKIKKKLLYTLIIFSILFIFCFCIFFLFKLMDVTDCNGTRAMGGIFIIKETIIIQKIFIFFFSFLSLIFIKNYLIYFNLLNIEFLILFLCSILGSLVVVSSGDFVLLYIGLELMSLPLYTIISLNNFYKISYEASLKYFIMGCLSSVFLLFGMSLLYGLHGTLNIRYIWYFFNNLDSNPGNLVESIFFVCPAFLLIAASFKFGAAPFHMWVPDVYRGSLSSIIMILGTIPKIASYALMQILIDLVLRVEYMLHFSYEFLCVVALLSILIGNFGALNQVNIKRLLGYSAIANVGFIIFGFIVSMRLIPIDDYLIITDQTVDLYRGGDDFASSWFYLIVYLVSFCGIVFILCILSVAFNKEIELVTDFKGLFYLNPSLAIFFSIFLFSLIGIPPLVGFYAKFFILLQLYCYDFFYMVILILVMSAIGSYYYLKILKEIFFYKPKPLLYNDNGLLQSNNKNIKIQISFFDSLFLFLLSFFVIFCGFYPNLLLDFILIS